MTLVHLHVHDTFSAYDAVGHPAELAQRARELGQPALATTNHGSLRGLYAAAVACREAGIKYLAGVEAYVCDDAEQRGLTKEDRALVLARFPDEPAIGKGEVLRLQAERKERDHITLWAMTDEGLRNLFRLMAWAWNEGFYYRPRVDMQRLRQWSAGIAASTGCPGGVVTSPLRRGDLRTAVDRASELADIFGDRLYCELMPHVPEDGDRLYAQKLLRIAERVGAKVVATGDVHYPLPADAVAQDALLCIHQKKRVDDPGRQKFDGNDYWMTSREELAGQLRRAHPWMKLVALEAALDETLAFAERCTANVVKVQPGAFLAGPPVPEDGNFHVDHQDWLVHVCCDAARAHGLLEQRVYENRLNHELRVIGEYGFAPYLMMVAELRKWARENGVMCGPGRGSSAGSLVCMLLGITDIDPVRYDLSFERFVEPGRSDPPDCDIDHDPDGADRLEEHLRGLYGGDRVVGISTFTMLGGKSTLRDMARVHGVPERELTPLLELIDEGSEEEEGTGLVDVLESTTEGRAFAERYPDVAGCVARLEGNMRAAGRHPGGLIISSVPVADVAPVETRAKGKARIPVLAYDMRAAEQIGFVKLDNLRLSALELLRRFRERTGIDPRRFDFESEAVLSAFTAGRLAGIFQFDTPSARRLCSGFEFQNFGDVALINALNRPGPKRSGLVEHCLECHKDPFAVEPVHPIWDHVFSGTYNVPVYQEQLIALARRMAGYTPEEAAQFRRKIAKSKGLSDEANKFIDGAVVNGVPSALATDIFERVVGFGRYCFNKCLDARTEVLVNGAIRRIGEIRVGDVVLTSAGPKSVMRICMTRKLGVRLRLEDGRSVIASEDHRFFRPTGVEVCVRDLREGDEIGVVRQSDVFGWRLHEQGSVQGADLQHALQPAQEVRSVFGAWRTLSVEQRDDEGDGRADREGFRGAHRREELGIQGRSHEADSRTQGEGPMRSLWRERASACGGSPQERGPRGQSVGEPGGAVRVVSQEDALSRTWEESEGRRWGSFGASSMEHWADEGDGRRGARSRRLEEGPEERARNDALVAARVVATEIVGMLDMVDIEVEAPHDFFLANGVLSHNSHSYSYAGLAVWMMAAKLAAPGEFYRAALEVEQDEKARLSLVAEARRVGIPVRAPSVTMPAGGMRLNEQGREILASLIELKGVGGAALEVLCAVPPKNLRELAVLRSPRLNGSVFGVLARADALRDLEGVQHHRFFAVNHQAVWKWLAKGRVPVLADGALPDFTPGEAAAEIERLWPLYVDEDGASAIDHAAATLRGRMPFPVRVLGDPMLDVPGMSFVVARLAERRVFPDGGRVSGRLVLTSADGQLHQVKVDADVLDAMKVGELADGDTLLLAVHRGERGGGVAEAVWRVTAAPGWLCTVPQSRPQDPVAAVSKLAKYAPTRLNGLRVVRAFRTRDKNGGPMLSFGLLGKRSYLRAYAFARNVGGLSPVQIGALVNVVGESLGGAVVSVRELEVV